MPILLIAIILGLLEGVTEFLPISSTGHLIIAEQILKFKDVQDIFTVIIQLGAIAAVIWFYRHDLIEKTRGLLARQPKALNFWKLVIIATIPAGLIGLVLDKHVAAFSKPSVIGWALIAGGIILWLVDRGPVIAGRRQSRPQIETITIRQAVLIGLGQCLAIIPGVSRSGATIVTGLVSGVNRPTATAFSFYLSLPVLILASALKLVKHPQAVGQLPGGLTALIVGVTCAFVAAFFSISWLLNYVSRHNFRPFAIYRIIIGSLILLFIH